MAGIFETLGLGAILSFKESGARTSMSGVSAATKDLKSNLAQLGTGVARVTGGLSKLALASAPLSLALGFSVAGAAKFETGMARIATLLGGSDMERIPELGKGIDQLSREFGIGAEVLQDGTFQAISAGINAADAMGFMRIASKAAVGGFTEVNTAVDGLTNVMNAYGLTGEENALKVSDAFFVANKLGKTTFGEIAASIGMVSSGARALGIEYSDLTSVIATGTAKSGLSTSIIVTQMKALQTSLSKPTTAAEKMAAKLGLAFGPEAVKKAGGFLPFMEQLAAKTKGDVGTMAALFDSSEGRALALTLTSKEGLEGLRDAIRQTTQATTSLTEESFQKVAQTSEFAFKQVQQTLASMGRSVGSVLLPLLVTVLKPIAEFLQVMAVELGSDKGFGGVMKEVATDVAAVMQSILIPAMNRAIDFITGMGPTAKKTVVLIAGGLAGIAAAATVVGPIMLAIGGTISGLVSTVSGLWTILTAVAGLMSGPLIVGVAVLAAGFVVAREHWDSITQAAMEFWAGLQGTFGQIQESVQANLLPPLMSIWDTLKGIFETIIGEGDASAASWSEIGAIVGNVFAALVDSIGFVASAFGVGFAFITEKIIKPFIRALKSVVGGVIDILTGATSVKSGLIKVFSGLAGIMLTPFRLVLTGIASVITVALRMAADLASNIPGIGTTIAEGYLLAANKVEDLAGGINSAIGFEEETPGTDLAEKGLKSKREAEGKKQQVDVTVQAGDTNVNVSPPKVELDGRKVQQGLGLNVARDNARGAHKGRTFSPSQRQRIIRAGVEVVPVLQGT